MTPTIKPFRILYDDVIKDRKPIKSCQCPLGQTYMHDIAEYLLHELYSSVKNFQSDFLLDWSNIMDAMKTLKPNHTIVYPIAFRENGVDGPTYITLRAENGMNDFLEIYISKKVYLLACVADDTAVHVSLYPIYDDIIHHFDLFQSI